MRNFIQLIIIFVTGGSAGIGLAYAKELAARKVNVVLISEKEEQLRRVSAEIENEFSVQTKIITADFREGLSVYERIENELKDIQVGILVNNVGIFAPKFLFFTEMSDDLIWNMVQVNVVPLLMMTKMLLPKMKDNRKGAIVNVSSVEERQPAPLTLLYSTTKTFMRNFTKALQYENHGSGITIQLLSPAFIQTDLSSFHGFGEINTWLAPKPNDYAPQAIGTLGILDHTPGYLQHAVMTSITDLLGEGLRTNIMAFFFGTAIKVMNAREKRM